MIDICLGDRARQYPRMPKREAPIGLKKERHLLDFGKQCLSVSRPTREPFAEPGVKNLQHNLEKLTRRLEAELRGSPPARRQRSEDPGRDPIAVPDDIAEKDPAR